MLKEGNIPWISKGVLNYFSILDIMINTIINIWKKKTMRN